MRTTGRRVRRSTIQEARISRAAGLVVAALVVLGCAHKPANFDVPAAKKQDQPQRELVGAAEATIYSSSGARWRLYTVKWQKARVDFLNAQSFGGDLTGVAGTMYKADVEANTFSADTARADSGSSALQLSGNVVVTSANPVSTLRCDSLAWDPDRGIVRATGNVSVETPSYRLSGYDQLWASPTLDQIATPSKFKLTAESNHTQ